MSQRAPAVQYRPSALNTPSATWPMPVVAPIGASAARRLERTATFIRPGRGKTHQEGTRLKAGSERPG